MNIIKLSPQQVAEKMASGATLIDIRDDHEYARTRIDGAICLPIDELQSDKLPKSDGDNVVIFHCLSGFRTTQNADKLTACVGDTAYILDGGLQAWKKAGLPIISDRTQPISIMRQVQIVAGVLILLGVVLGSLMSPVFYGLSGFVGAGLLFAGLTGFCGMAKLLAFLPYNCTSN
ncbi:MAG: rhodanese family protein [Moraxella sp.]|nr:rhodanese family protein [Moraxella sp.]